MRDTGQHIQGDGTSPVASPTWRTRVLLLAGLSSMLVMSQFLRNSVGVIAPDLAADLALDSDDLGLLGGAFFMTFAVTQIPAGIAIDRYGPRRAMLALFWLVIVGCVLFATAEGQAGLVVARALMGLGCACLFMAPLTVISRWFAADRFAGYVALLLAVGSLGTLAATAPLALLAEWIGWRMSFALIAALALGAGVVAWATVSDAPPGHPSRTRARESWRESFAGIGRAVAQPDVAPVFAMHAAVYAMFATMLGLWAGPYLAAVYGLDLTARGGVLFVLAACQITGLLVWGRMDRVFNSRKKPVLAGACATMALLGLLAFGPVLPVWGIVAVFALYGFACAYTPALTAHGRALFPDELVGRGITFLNTAVMSGVFVVQFGTGVVLDIAAAGAPAGEAAYRACFTAMLAALAAATLAYLRARDRKPLAGNA